MEWPTIAHVVIMLQRVQFELEPKLLEWLLVALIIVAAIRN